MEHCSSKCSLTAKCKDDQNSFFMLKQWLLYKQEITLIIYNTVISVSSVKSVWIEIFFLSRTCLISMAISRSNKLCNKKAEVKM